MKYKVMCQYMRSLNNSFKPNPSINFGLKELIDPTITSSGSKKHSSSSKAKNKQTP